jgi:NDP-sugar pyrophosphorylase family protein
MSLLPAAILAGGLGTRLLPLTADAPKALIEVNGEPFLAHQLRLLASRGIDRVVLCTGHLGERIENFAGDGSRFGVRIDYSRDGAVLRGTAGAVRNGLPLLGDRFFVLYGDSYLPCDYEAVQNAFEASGKSAMMTVFRNEGRWDSSNVEFSEGRMVAYDKIRRTGRMQHIDYGLGVFHQRCFERVPAEEPYDLAALYQELLATGELAGLEVAQRFYETGSPEGIRELSLYLRP